ncbi:hypothetical protein PIB30_090289 [Stylosanthes scabra]|uniref:Uncharacterized protein n=1 Tax=Stylosanthes scabra TaxID=79078 RepID=A0ABU6TUU2_9FABA|nr:hypothetical protein [Stylosanthes scabra]
MDKRMWSDEKTEAFISFKEEFIVDGTWPDCGQFRTGTFEKLVLKMIEQFPNCTLMAKHCRIFGKDRATGSVAFSSFDAEEQFDEEQEDDEPILDDYFMSSTPTADGSSQIQGNAGQGTTSSVDPNASSKRISRKKRKQADILERMSEEVHESIVAQREHVQIFANAISGKNEEVKMGEKLE